MSGWSIQAAVGWINKGGQDARKDLFGAGGSWNDRGCNAVLVRSSDGRPDRLTFHPPDCVRDDLPFQTSPPS